MTESELKSAYEKYQIAQARLKNVCDDVNVLRQYAQEANDAWLQFKKLEIAFNNHNVYQKGRELYGI